MTEKQLSKLIEYIRKELSERKWEWERKGFRQETEERLERLEQLYDDLYGNSL